MMDTLNIKDPFDKLRAAARKDPKKAGILAVLVLVMAGLWVKVLVHPTPASAGAARARASAAAAKNAPPARASNNLRRDTDAFAPRLGATRRAWATVKLAPVDRNLFLVDYDRFEKAGKSTAAAAAVQQTGDSSDGPAKSGPAPADQKKERQILAANLQAQAGQLKLQTTVMGPSPKALVNGTLVGEGDTVASFRIVKITARGMVIEREGIRLEVQMK